MKWFKNILNVVKREINIIANDKDLLLMLIAAPLFYSLFYGTMYIDKTEEKVPVAVLNLDKSTTAENFIKDLNSHQLINVKTQIDDAKLIKDILIKEEVQGVIVIPENFSQDLKYLRGTTIKIFLNTHRFLHSNDLNKAVNEIALTKGQEIKANIFAAKGYNLEQAEEISTPMKDEIHFLFNPSETYGDFLIPAILVLVLQQTLLFGLTQSIAKEKEAKTMHELYNFANNNISSILIGKSFFYIALYMIYALFFYTVHFHLFKIPFKGSIFTLALTTFLLLATISILSLIIGSFFSKKVYALIFMSFTSYPLFFFTGYTWPIFAMPKIIQYFSYIVPTTPYMQSMNRIINMGASFQDITPEIINLSLLLILFIFLAVLRFYTIRKKLKFTFENNSNE
ncbi:MAG: ABC transporter permease [Candidatus Kapaibacteriota bacterium]